MADKKTPVLTVTGVQTLGNRCLQADLAAFNHRSVYGVSIITGVVTEGLNPLEAEILLPGTAITRQFGEVFRNFDIKACKIGSLPNLESIIAVERACSDGAVGPVVLDPFLFNENHKLILDEQTLLQYVKRLLPITSVITPSVEEAEALVGFPINSDEDLIHAANELRGSGVRNVFITGEHKSENPQVIHDYVLLQNGDDFWLTGEYIKDVTNVGAGDTLSALVAAGLAKNDNVEMALRDAKEFVTVALKSAVQVSKAVKALSY
ncbi:bifunctional hydroxymethylpyrimidine kinase/phosphomethylpyrimidine kinase [Furfurilactobacillus entadae]|uniref:bifunctional hydroxymethylpyrimidine kinase/phosphomethylpyrimidine kinase n=1 Tax=Furfurilactobacillus entadae TaxID=2922307 RepID=UPI0035EEF155